MHSVRTREIAFDHVFGEGVWQYRAQHPEHARIFDQAMANLSGVFNAARPTVAVTRSSDSPALVAVLGALYVMEGAVLLCAMVLYKNGHQPLLLLLTGRHGPAFVGGVLSLLVAGAYLILAHRRTPAGERREFWFTVAMNVVTVMVLLILGETTIRLFASRTSAGIVFADTVLLPRSWDNVIARNRELLESAEQHLLLRSR